MVYCAAFYCNANSSKNKVTWFKFPTEPTLFKKAYVKPTKHSRCGRVSPPGHLTLGYLPPEGEISFPTGERHPRVSSPNLDSLPPLINMQESL